MKKKVYIKPIAELLEAQIEKYCNILDLSDMFGLDHTNSTDELEETDD